MIPTLQLGQFGRSMSMPLGGPVPIASADVVMLLQMDGTGATFTDSGPNTLAATAVGNPTQSTTADAHGKAMEVSGAASGNYLSVGGTSLFNRSTFSINTRVKLTSSAGSNQAFFDLDVYTKGLLVRINLNTSTELTVYANSVANNMTFTWPTTVFAEIELCQNGTNLYVFINGTLSLTVAAVTFNATPELRINGHLAGGSSGTTTKFFDDFLIATTCLHTTSYTPRTGPYVIV